MVQPVRFIDTGVKEESAWRGVVLLGRNVQSYKFALARSLLDLAVQGKTRATLEELAMPFTRHLLDHIRRADKQGTSRPGPVLNACLAFEHDEIDESRLITEAVRGGFNDVLNRFHTVGSDPIDVRFYEVSGKGVKRTLTLTDQLLGLPETDQFANLVGEVEGRWRLVETAWELGITTHSVAPSAEYDRETGGLSIRQGRRRRSISGTRGAIGGYQKGVCFYCFRPVIENNATDSDVDHFFPWSHQSKLYGPEVNLDGVWNLVIACRECNRGQGGKFDRLPALSLLERLHHRNEYFISSHHPLREAIIGQTGASLSNRSRFLNEIWNKPREHGFEPWSPVEKGPPLIP